MLVVEYCSRVFCTSAYRRTYLFRLSIPFTQMRFLFLQQFSISSRFHDFDDIQTFFEALGSNIFGEKTWRMASFDPRSLGIEYYYEGNTYPSELAGPGINYIYNGVKTQLSQQSRNWSVPVLFFLNIAIPIGMYPNHICFTHFHLS